MVCATDATHEDTIVAASIVSLAAYYQTLDDPNWRDWLRGRFTKTVRRAKNRRWVAAQAKASATVVWGTGQASAWPPALYSDYPPFLSRLQVSGTDFPRTSIASRPVVPSPHPRERAVSDADACLCLWVWDNLTTGKACAQAAHAVWMWALDTEPETVAAWVDRPQVALHLVGKVPAVESGWVVTDAGFTEVSPGTVTAAATWE